MSRIPPELFTKIEYYAKFSQTGVSLRQMVQFGKNPSQGTLLRATQFLSEELPIRLAHRVVELESLPNNLNRMPSTLRVRDWYVKSFEELVSFPKPNLPNEIKSQLKAKLSSSSQVLPPLQPNPYNSYYSNGSPAYSHSHLKRYYVNCDDLELPESIVQYNKDFVKLINNIKTRHDSTVPTLAQGVVEYKRSLGKDIIDMEIQTFLDRFYMSRIGIRMLIGQHVALQNSTTNPPPPDHVGVICTKTKVKDIAQDAIENSRFICADYYGLFEAPKVALYCDDNVHFMYVPSHLHHMLFELLKNSLRAVVERFGVDAEDKYPPIKLIVAEGKEDITVKISDEGGGIPRSCMPMVWTYMYTTAEAPSLDPDTNQSDFKVPLAGFGYGLPISRLYARYFGGDLILISMEGYGTDAYLHLNRLSDSEEPLP